MGWGGVDVIKGKEFGSARKSRHKFNDVRLEFFKELTSISDTRQNR